MKSDGNCIKNSFVTWRPYGDTCIGIGTKGEGVAIGWGVGNGVGMSDGVAMGRGVGTGRGC